MEVKVLKAHLVREEVLDAWWSEVHWCHLAGPLCIGMTMKTATSTTTAETLHKIDGFAALEPDWDSYGGRTIAIGAIETAKNLILALASMKSPQLHDGALSVWVAPVPNGNVLLEWQGPSADLEIEVTASGALDILLTAHTANGDRYTEESNVGLQDVASLLDKVLSA